MLFYRWIRESVRNAVLGGVQDALDEINDVAKANSEPLGYLDPGAREKPEQKLAGPEQKKGKKS